MRLGQDLVQTTPTAEFSDSAWLDVLRAVDSTYAELVSYQERLEQQNAELESLRRSMASVLDSVSDVLVVVDRDGRMEETSASLRALFAEPGSLAGQPMAGIVDEGSRTILEAALHEVMVSRRRLTVEADLASPSGPQTFEWSLTPRLDDRRRSKGAVLVGRPVGELRRAYEALENSHRALQEAQAQLVRNEKMASLGRLLAGVAHELNNPISFVYANVHALERYASRFEAYFERVQAGALREELVRLRAELKLDREVRNLRTAIDGARDGAERVRDIVADLRRLSADGSGEAIAFDLAETVRVAANWVLRGAKHKPALTIEGEETLRAIGRAGHIQQVVMNLIQNALDAVAETDDPVVTVTLMHGDGMAVVEVQDNGPGVPPEARGRIFDPFFTTKPVGKGTGLGLSISAKIAEEHGGALRLLDGPPGATFRLSIPEAR
ncbi:sensor histidine kinase [Rubellimicrobium arenae]|uniref:sensor histidine kinase n=1 Tax=Rubellimicrobium arenae TaxID=2817372 RepID=UPI0034A2F72D